MLLLLIGGWGLSCTPKVAQKIGTKPNTDASETIKNPIPVSHPPVSIDGGIHLKKIYANMPHDITINVEGGSSAHLVIGTTNGKLTAVDASKGKYSFFCKYPGIVVEIYATDTINAITVAESYEIVPMPAPNAFIWTYRKPISYNSAMEMDAATFRAQNAVILYHSYKVPVYCEANSFKITRIAINGEKNSHLNKDPSGKFEPQAMAIVQAAEVGDIYVVENIESLCTPEIIRSIIYTIK